MEAVNTSELSFEIVAFLPKKSGQSKASEPSFQPFSVRRKSDGEIFSIGDRVTNGMIWQEKGLPMACVITGFDFLESTCYVNHTWSGIGMDLDSLTKEPLLPCKFQPEQIVYFHLLGVMDSKARVLSVHFHGGGVVKYDIEVELEPLKKKTRLYNVEQVLLRAI